MRVRVNKRRGGEDGEEEGLANIVAGLNREREVVRFSQMCCMHWLPTHLPHSGVQHIWFVCGVAGRRKDYKESVEERREG
jgi:hypothetical protein